MNTKQPKTLYELCDESKSHARKRSRNNDNSGSLLRKKAKLPRSQNLSKVEHKQQTLECGASIPIRPQVEVIDGKIVVSESSLTVSMEPGLCEDDYEEIVESGSFPSSSYSSFLHRSPSKIWGIGETKQFYQALRQCGTDFSLMQAFFPNRTRRQLKLKFFREEKQLPELIKRVLHTNLPLDLAALELYFGELQASPLESVGSNAVGGAFLHRNLTEDEESEISETLRDKETSSDLVDV